jgi:hypothetical protein
MIDPATYSDTQYLSLKTGKSSQAEPGNTPTPPTGDLKDSVNDPIPQSDISVVKTQVHDTLEWDSLLFDNRERPFVDIQLYPDANKVRLPISVKDYNLYADTGKFYEDVTIDGSVSIGQGISGDLDVAGTLQYLRAIEVVTQNKTISIDDKSKIIHVEPDAASVTLTLPASGIPIGFTFDVINAKQGAFTVISTEAGTLKAKHPGLSQAYSSATVYWTGSDWFAIGDLTPVV